MDRIQEYAWLKDTLASNTQSWLIVFFHIPPYDVGLSSGLTYPTSVGKDLMPLFKQYHVNLVFNGHMHIYYQTIVDGVRYLTTGGAGDPYYLVKVDGKSMVVKGISHGNTLDVLNLNMP